jgi:hypothetical protein
MLIQSNQFLAFLLDPLLRRPRSTGLTGDLIKIVGRRETEISLDKMTSAPMVVSSGPVTALVITPDSAPHFRLSAINPADANKSTETVKRAWHRFNCERLLKHKAQIDNLLMKLGSGPIDLAFAA